MHAAYHIDVTDVTVSCNFYSNRKTYPTQYWWYEDSLAANTARAETAARIREALN